LFSELLEDIKRKKLARNWKGKIVGRKKRLEILHPVTHIKWNKCWKKKREKKQISSRTWQKSKYLGISLVDQNDICNEIKSRFSG
jgi:hypothetical protein